MVIECLIKSDGPTRFTSSPFVFVFKENERGHKVCNVCSREAREHMLSLPDFRVYVEPEPEDLDIPPVDMSETPMPNTMRVRKTRKGRVKHADCTAVD